MMNKLKIIIAVCFILQSPISFGQTKSDTIEWLKNTLDVHFNKIREKNNVDNSESCGFICDLIDEASFGAIRSRTLLSINECEIKIWKGEELLTIPVKGLSLAKSEVFSDKYSFVQSDEIIKSEMETDGKRTVRFIENSGLMIDNTIAPDLSKRIEKALKHLATFCDKKEDLF